MTKPTVDMTIGFHGFYQIITGLVRTLRGETTIEFTTRGLTIYTEGRRELFTLTSDHMMNYELTKRIEFDVDLAYLLEDIQYKMRHSGRDAITMIRLFVDEKHPVLNLELLG